ncbi:N-acetylmuramoyl-L-alanine amidase [Actinoplanes sp. NPDC026623]|uniref:N-acetylmuramoyl-L-alanine amidase n=1 Tax=Actinoplanes sp. NPDC026623 TaxID=3155610 RepID=UPI0033DF8A85
MLCTAVVVSGAAAVSASGAAAAQQGVAADQLSRAPDPPTLQTIELAPAPGRAAAAGARAVPRRATGRFSLVGATWTDSHAALDGAVEVRTRRSADGSWTGWQSLEADGASPAEPGSRDAAEARGSTDPLWVGESDGVEARVAAGPGRAGPLPAGLRLDLIDPGDPPPPAPPAPAPRVAVPPRPAPRLVSRAGWGANEAIVRGEPEYTTDVQVLFVHHTAGTNDYRCSESAAIIRGIEAYHVRSNHWDDIGYNFLVDKCGTLFEGRRGGVARPVLGAHTLGFNSRSSAIAVLGNYSGRAVPARVRQVIAQVAAYKIGAYGNTPAGRVAMVSSGSDRYSRGTRATLNRISGHRDTGKTECPGNTLYAQLGAIRGVAAAGPANLALSKINGATRIGRSWYTRGTVRPFWRTTTPSSLLYRFDVQVDGALTASAPNGHRDELLRLPAGRHDVRIRAVALNGRMASISVPIVSDRTLPEFTGGPSVLLRTGSLDGIVPVRLRWTAADAGGLRRVTLTGPVTADLGTTATAWAGTVRPGVATTYGLRATDLAGNVRSAAVTRTPVIVAETQAVRSGAWRSLSGAGHLGGSALRSTAANASLSWTFTGRSASLAVARTAASGRVQVYVDGSPAGMIDLRSPRSLYRRAVWTRSWNSSERHTVKIRVEGTSGRPGVISDGLVYLR